MSQWTADSFFPPGKVADFWGFQYLRDNDPTEMGHNTDFLTRAANNVLYILNASQRAELESLARSQVDDINQYAYDRFVLMKAFRRLLAGEAPTGAAGLSETAEVKGEIKAKNILIGGKMDGNVRAQELVEIKSKGKVLGDIFTPKLAIIEGGEFNGKVEMKREENKVIELDLKGREVGKL